MSKSAKAVGDFVAANKMPIATGATAMALAALLSKRNRLAKALGWGAVGAGLGKAGQMYLDAYKRPEGSVPDYLKRQEAKPQEPVLNTDILGVSPRIQAAMTAANLPIAGRVPDYLKRQPAPVQEPVLNTDILGVSPRIQAAMTAANLPIAGRVPDYLKRQPAPVQKPVLNTDFLGASPRLQAILQGAKLTTRAERQQAREKALADLQSEGFGSRFLKDMVTGTGEALKERAASLAVPVGDLYNRAKGDVGALNEASRHNKEAEKNIKRMRDELEAMKGPRRKETLLDTIMRRLSK